MSNNAIFFLNGILPISQNVTFAIDAVVPSKTPIAQSNNFKLAWGGVISESVEAFNVVAVDEIQGFCSYTSKEDGESTARLVFSTSTSSLQERGVLHVHLASTDFSVSVRNATTTAGKNAKLVDVDGSKVDEVVSAQDFYLSNLTIQPGIEYEVLFILEKPKLPPVLKQAIGSGNTPLRPVFVLSLNDNDGSLKANTPPGHPILGVTLTPKFDLISASSKVSTKVASVQTSGEIQFSVRDDTKAPLKINLEVTGGSKIVYSKPSDVQSNFKIAKITPKYQAPSTSIIVALKIEAETIARRRATMNLKFQLETPPDRNMKMGFGRLGYSLEDNDGKGLGFVYEEDPYNMPVGEVIAEPECEGNGAKNSSRSLIYIWMIVMIGAIFIMQDGVNWWLLRI
eukprot:Filipodium_phascolosomae@DN8023_c0_g1_i2.p1